jgi:hypothetical protein
MPRSSVWFVYAFAALWILGIFACATETPDTSEFAAVPFDASPSDGGSPADPNGFEPLTDGGGVIADDGASFGCDAGCPSGFSCVHAACLPEQPPCFGAGADAAVDGGSAEAGACQYDTFCDEATGKCVPFGVGGKTGNASCTQPLPPGNFVPIIKCTFPLEGVAPTQFPAHVDVQATPMVARFGPPSTPPSIVVPFSEPVALSYTENRGVIRVLRGTDCTEEAVIGGVDLDGDGVVDWARTPSSVGIADLDGDGLPEIVAYMSTRPNGVSRPMETLMAFTRKSGTWLPLWTTKKATLVGGATFNANNVPFVGSGGTDNWASPSIHDLDDDGLPEIIREGWVIDGQTGVVRADPPPMYATYKYGISPVLANLDADAKIELTNGSRIWEFDGASNTWVEEASYTGVSSPPGWTGIADFDPYVAGTKTPEIVVSSGGTLAIYRTDHATFMGMTVAIPGGGGGPPTIADFDGDGLPEVGIAGQAFYTVFDPDCQANPRPGGQCADRTHCDHAVGGCPDKILWSRATQDISSNVTGSSVFDFEGDGRAEVVYADECFARVYSGRDGRVLFSQFTSSCTWNEYPVVADIDGDFRAELVVAANTACGPIGVGRLCTENVEAGGVDKQFAGIGCKEHADCISGLCDAGLCRCMTSSGCCAAKDDSKCEASGVVCAAPPAGTEGAGNTCRASHPRGVQGIRVFEDAADSWVRARPLWNQHAYSVTHINDDGTVPKTSAWPPNFSSPGLNNFRQNVPGAPNARGIADFTAGVSTSFQCLDDSVILRAPVCNRGAGPAAAGVRVGFYDGASLACHGITTNALEVGECETVSCTWGVRPSAMTNVAVFANDDRALTQCNAENDRGLVRGVVCSTVE